MKSKDIQKIVSSKYEKGEGPTKIFRDLNGAVGLRTLKRWCIMLRDTGSIELSSSPGRPRIVRTKGTITKVKNRLQQNKPISTRKLPKEFNISRRSIQRILRNDLGLFAYKKIREPKLTDEHKDKRKKFANWIRTNFRKEETMKILFSDEKLFDIDGVYNSQNDRVWAVSRGEADKQGGIKQTRKFPEKVAVCSKGVSPVVIFENGTVDHSRYIQEVLPVALEYGDKVFGNQWTFQQDNAKPHVHHLTQQWCRDNFPSFIDKDHWPPNSPDLNPLDYSIWDEFVHAIKWDKVTSKKTLIEELKKSVKKIRTEVVFESCSSWTSRLHRLSINNGSYLR